MARIILLDAGIIGLLVSEPSLPQVAASLTWLRSLPDDADVTIAEIADYEVRRELLRLGAVRKLGRLANLRMASRLEGMTESAWAKAAEFWALVRRAGVPTSSPDALDADAILAAIAATLRDAGNPVTIATTNVRHLTRFPGIDARNWRDVA